MELSVCWLGSLFTCKHLNIQGLVKAVLRGSEAVSGSLWRIIADENFLSPPPRPTYLEGRHITSLNNLQELYLIINLLNGNGKEPNTRQLLSYYRQVDDTSFLSMCNPPCSFTPLTWLTHTSGSSSDSATYDRISMAGGPDAVARPYSYRALESNLHFLLITLLPGVHNDPISRRIEHVSLDLQPKYEALSYVWGHQSPQHPIQCDGYGMTIGPNLHDALLCLRRPSQDRVLWIDRAAINQTDLDERASQVNLMDDIYRLASQVVVWVGPADDSTELAVELVEKLYRQYIEFHRQNPNTFEEASTQAHTIAYPPAQDPAWLALWELLKRSSVAERTP